MAAPGRLAGLHRRGEYTARGWTEWTQGFQFGAAVLQFDATGDARSSSSAGGGRSSGMAPHLTHVGVHDHGFNNVSTYGDLWRLAREGRVDASDWERQFYELALKVSGAVQARALDAGCPTAASSTRSTARTRCSSTRSGRCASLALAHQLGHVLSEEQDAQVSLLERLRPARQGHRRVQRLLRRGAATPTTCAAATAHEAIFNTVNGSFRCPNSQQGYSPFSTWTRGLAWAMLGFAEQLEFLDARRRPDPPSPSRASHRRPGSGACDRVDDARGRLRPPATSISTTRPPADGIPYWDTGAPGLGAAAATGRPRRPTRSTTTSRSTARRPAIAAQGLLRLGRYLTARGDDGARYVQAGLRGARHALRSAGPYLSDRPGAPGPDPALGLPPAERLGPRA